jgi:hypothetical protein
MVPALLVPEYTATPPAPPWSCLFCHTASGPIRLLHQGRKAAAGDHLKLAIGRLGSGALPEFISLTGFPPIES